MTAKINAKPVKKRRREGKRRNSEARKSVYPVPKKKVVMGGWERKEKEVKERERGGRGRRR